MNFLVEIAIFCADVHPFSCADRKFDLVLHKFQTTVAGIIAKGWKIYGTLFLVYKEHSVIDNCKDQLSL